MNESFKKKLNAYIILSTGYLAMHSEKSDAQIIYTDVNPDADIYNDLGWAWNLDLNNDGITDFNFSYWDYRTSYNGMSTDSSSNSRINRLNSNEVVSEITGVFPAQLETGDTINGNKTFNQGGAIHGHWMFNHAYGGSYGSGSGDHSTYGVWSLGVHFIGLKLNVGGFNYFGWARISRREGYGIGNGFVVYDYAYNSQPNLPVLAGDWDVAYLPLHKDTILLFIDQKQLHLFDKKNQYLSGDINIYDVLSRKIITKKIDNSEEIISLENFIPGLYIAELRKKVAITNEDKVIVLKFIIK